MMSVLETKSCNLLLNFQKDIYICDLGHRCFSTAKHLKNLATESKCLDADIHVIFACARCSVLCHGGVPVSSFDRETSLIVFGYAMPYSSFFYQTQD